MFPWLLLSLTFKGRLLDYTIANDLWKKIKSEELTTWEEFDNKYKLVLEDIKGDDCMLPVIYIVEGFRVVTEGKTFALHGRREYKFFYWNFIKPRFEGNSIEISPTVSLNKHKLETVNEIRRLGTLEFSKEYHTVFIHHNVHKHLILVLFPVCICCNVSYFPSHGKNAKIKCIVNAQQLV
jgi:hypothetical protein